MIIFTKRLGYALTFFTLESVFPLVVLSVGIAHGIGFVLVYATAIGTAQKWFPPENRGFMGSIVVRYICPWTYYNGYENP